MPKNIENNQQNHTYQKKNQNANENQGKIQRKHQNEQKQLNTSWWVQNKTVFGWKREIFHFQETRIGAEKNDSKLY